MVRRRKVGSSIVLSAVAALAVVGLGLAAAVTPATAETNFGFEFVSESDTPIGTVTALTMDDIKLVVNEANKTIALKNPIFFTFDPDDTLTGHTFEMTYTFTMPESFDTYFTLSTELTGTVQADPAQSMASEDAITFTIGTNKLAGSSTDYFDAAKTAFEKSGIIKISATVNDVTGTEGEGEETDPETPAKVTDPVTLTAEVLGIGSSYNETAATKEITAGISSVTFEYTSLMKGNGGMLE